MPLWNPTGTGGGGSGGVAASLAGNTAGTLALVSTGTLILAGGNNITLSQNGQSVTISGPNAGGAQTGISGLVGSDATYTSGTVTLTGVGGGITVNSNTGQRIDLSVAAPVAQTVQTQNLVDWSLSTTAGGATAGTMALASSGTVTLYAGNNITLSQSATNKIIISGPNTSAQQTGISSIQGSDATYTSGKVIFTGVGGGITVSSNTGQRIDISVAAPVAQTAQTGISSIAASDATYTSGQVQFTGSNMVTVKSSAGQRVVIDATQSVQVVQSAVQASDATYTSGKVIFTGTGGGVTVNSNTGQRVDISVAAPVAQTVQTQNMVAVSATNTLYSSGTVLFTGSNMITVKSSANNQTIILDATQSVQTQNLFALTLSSNTSGTLALVSSGTLTLAGGNNITLSQAGNAVTISAPNLGAGNSFGAGVSTFGNTAGSTGTVSQAMYLVGSGPISLSQSTGGASNATVSILGPATSSLSASTNITLSVTGSTVQFSVANFPKIHLFENMPEGLASPMTNLTQFTKTPIYWAEVINGPMTLNSLGFKVSQVNTSTHVSFSVHLGLYTLANSTSANLVASASDAFVVSSGSSASFSGTRAYVMTSPSTVAGLSNITPGNYIFGMMFSAGGTSSINAVIYGMGTASGGNQGYILPGNNQLTTGTSQGPLGLRGRGSTTVNVMPANVSAADLINQGTGSSVPLRPYIFIRS